jgi:four helix bundle protein
MAPKHFRELQCWRLSDELRREVNVICAIWAVERDRRFCEGFRDAAGSVCRNLSEGFARFHSADIVQFFTYALASLAEVQDCLAECLTRQAIDKPRHDRLFDLSEHAKATALNFMRPHAEKLKKHRASARRT